MKTLGLLFAGLVFGVGLVLSGMTEPAKIIGFLDISGAWDPSLAFVMAGAIGVHAVGTRFIYERPAPVLESRFEAVNRGPVDRRLVIGAALFGVGWGLSGYCPGPALVGLVTLNTVTLAFVASMALGIVLFHLLDRRPTSPKVAAPVPHGQAADS